jgi:hypothetical protein
MAFEKANIKGILGWALLAIGLLIVCWPLYCSYNIFSGKTEAPQVFTDQIQAEKNTGSQAINPQEQAKEETEQIIADQIEKIVPSSFIPRIFNLISWSIFVVILIFGGSKISLLGIRLMKNSC